MTALLASALAAAGVALILSAVAIRSNGSSGDSHAPGTAVRPSPVDRDDGRLHMWMLRNGLDSVSPRRFISVSALIGVLCAGTVVVLSGSLMVAAVLAALAAGFPAALWRHRARTVRRVAAASWPRLLEELRVRVGALGRPIPQALIEVGLRGPEELRPAFLAASREWSLTTDFARTVAVLKARLADSTADSVCETLLVAHEVGGDIDARLAALAEDRRVDQRDRQEADARQAGAKVARWFVVIVPAGMAFAGLSLGDGAESFESAGAQSAAVLAIVMIAACWWWASRIMRLPDERRVFDR